uniref:Uncharacterized protein n=1 Tax=Lepeophtheirus salmonis TaxID=72036 RepID=A0A0K2TFF0_LEPSM
MSIRHIWTDECLSPRFSLFAFVDVA